MSDNSKDSLNDSTNINEVSNKPDEFSNDEALRESSNTLHSDMSLSDESESVTQPTTSASDVIVTHEKSSSFASKDLSSEDESVPMSVKQTSELKDESEDSKSVESKPDDKSDQPTSDEAGSNEESIIDSLDKSTPPTIKNDESESETSSDSNSLKSLLNKPSSVIKPLIPPVNQITGALKRSIDWDAVPDKKASSPDADKSENIPFSATDADEKPPTISRRLQPRVVDNFVSFKNKSNSDDSEKDPDTAVLSENSPSWKKVIDAQAQGTTATIGEQREVLFVIRGMIERVVMKDNGIVTLGRFDTGTVPNAEIDLIPYGALDRGVSRRHCKIQLRDSQLYVTDLQSTNGTFLAGVRLKPQEPTILRKGDEVLLGRLAVQILFR